MQKLKRSSKVLPFGFLPFLQYRRRGIRLQGVYLTVMAELN